MALSGKKTVAVAGTAEALGTQAVNGTVAIKALTTNTGLVYLGDAATAGSTAGYPLLAGDVVIMTFVSTLGAVSVNSAVNGEGVAWLILGA